jgi:hypothetical protein
MPIKIITDKPQSVRKTVQIEIETDWKTIIEPPIFSVPLIDDDIATVDPDNITRELRGGQVFFSSPIIISNTSSSTATVEVEMISEGSTITTSLAPSILVPANDSLILPPGIVLIKDDLDNPTVAGSLLRVKGSANNVLTLTTTVVEKEIGRHSPDTESI